jgi:hypothetical protein
MATTKLWMLFREIITVYCESHTERISTNCLQTTEFLDVKAGGTYSYRFAVKSVSEVSL